MRKIILLAAMVVSLSASAQLTTTPNGGNKKAWVGERIGLTDVTIHYDRPAVKGREGKIFGGLIPLGFNDPVYGTSKSAPWRAGANENTTIEFSTDVKINGRDIPKGKYAFFVAIDPEECTLIFSKNNTSWGNYFYDESEDALRVKAKPIETQESQEWLGYEFTNQTPKSADVVLAWEKWRLPFTVQVDVVKTQLESFERELRSNKAFDAKNLTQAARYSLDNNANLEQGYKWAERAVAYEANFSTLSVKADMLEKMGKTDEANTTRNRAIEMATMAELNAYGRRLLNAKNGQKALEMYQLNYKKNPNVFATNLGLARGFSATGDYKKALDFAKKALMQAPDEATKKTVNGYIATLQSGKDMN